MTDKKQLCDWADELHFREIFEVLDKIPNKPKIALYNDLKEEYIAGESNRKFVGRIQTYIGLLDSPESSENTSTNPSEARNIEAKNYFERIDRIDNLNIN